MGPFLSLPKGLFGNHGRMNETNREMLHSSADFCQRAAKLTLESSAL
jgi:hypothetical protein